MTDGTPLLATMDFRLLDSGLADTLITMHYTLLCSTQNLADGSEPLPLNSTDSLFLTTLVGSTTFIKT
jgi:hypothetical protein